MTKAVAAKVLAGPVPFSSVCNLLGLDAPDSQRRKTTIYCSTLAAPDIGLAARFGPTLTIGSRNEFRSKLAPPTQCPQEDEAGDEGIDELLAEEKLVENAADSTAVLLLPTHHRNLRPTHASGAFDANCVAS